MSEPGVGPSLNPQQREAVEHPGGALLVLAGAGSGKTRVLTARVARLLDESAVPPDRVLAVTFTNRAAGEMRERIERQIEGDTRGMWIGTFHSLAARLLRREAGFTTRDRSFTIYDEDDTQRALKDAMERVGVDPRRWSVRALRSRISSAKNQMIGPDEFVAPQFDLMARAVRDVYPEYEALLRRRNAYDFDDLLLEAVRLLESVPDVGERYARRFVHVLVDEYQDTNPAQYRMVRALASRHGNLCVVGDDDQSIYAWRGADLRNILDFERDFPGAHVVRLEQNYRSTASILEVANAVIERNVDRKPKRLRTEREAGEPVRVVRTETERREAAWVAEQVQELGPGRLADVTILYRTNAQSRAFEEALRSARLPYRIVGGVPFYERREIKDVIAYLRLLVNPSDDAAFQRAIGWPRRGVGGVSLERLTEAASARDQPLLAEAATASAVASLPGAAARSLESFAASIDQLRAGLPAWSAREAVEATLKEFGIGTALADEEDGADRLENVSELLATAASFEPDDVDEAEEDSNDLELFLQTVALRTDLDQVELDGEAVTLMTLHNAKGLEFPLVFLAGLEEGLFPLSRAIETDEGLEEERRLFYVGVTRAMDRLAITYADRRWRAGMESRSPPSSFLDELPAEHTRFDDLSGRRRGGGGRRRSDFGSRGGMPAAGAAGASGPRYEDLGRESQFDWRQTPPGSRPQAEGREPRYDYSDSQEPLRLEPGARIVHPRFGEGSIRSVQGEGQNAKAEIEFDSVGRKKVVLAYAGLRPA